MLEYKKIENNTTLVLHNGDEVGSIKREGENFIIQLCDYTITVPQKHRQKIKNCLENHYRSILEMRKYEERSELAAIKRGFTTKG